MSSNCARSLDRLGATFIFMSTRRTVIYFIFGVLLFNFTILRPGDPPDEKTGAPGEGLCTDCHDVPGTQTGSITLSGLPAAIQPSTAYLLEIEIVQASPETDGDDRAGFQLVILGGNAETSASIGEFSSPGMNVAIDVAGGNSNRVYLEHMDARLFNGSNTLNYSATWTSPEQLPDSIYLYMTGILGNGSNGNSNDLMLQYINVLPAETEPVPNPPTVKLQDADLFFPDSTKGFVMKDINGNCWRFLVNTSGVISSSQIPCPE